MKNKSVASFRTNGAHDVGGTGCLRDLCDLTGEDARQIQRLVATGDIPRPANRGEYNLAESIRGLVNYYRERASKFSESRIEAATRRERAEAEISEISLLERKGEFQRYLEMNMLDLAVQVRQTIERAGYIPMSSRIRLSREMKTVSFNNLKPSKK